MKNILHILLVLCFSLTIISCSDVKEESTTAGSGTGDTNDGDTTTTDTTAPVLAEVAAITTPTTDTTPDYIFYSDQAGSITYGGSCSSSTTSAYSGYTTITLTSLSSGTYTNCTIIVTNSTGTASNTLTITSFTITGVADTTSPSVSSVSTTADNQSSVSPTDNITVTFSEAMDTSTITTNTSDTSCSGNLRVSSDSYSTCVRMSSSPISSNLNKTYTLDPNDNLSWNKSYYVRVTTGVKDSAGNSLGYQYNTSSAFITSVDPNRWGNIETHPYTQYSERDIESLTFGNNIFVAIDHRGNILKSTDGSSWTLESKDASRLYDVTFGNNIFVTVGNYSSSSTLYRSTDNASSWSTETPPVGSGDLLYDLTYAENTTNANNDYFVGVGANGKILRATDNGSNFSRLMDTQTTNDLYSVSYGNQSFVAVGESGTIVRGTDNGTAIVWVSKTSSTSNHLYEVTFGNNTFIGVGASGNIVRSTDNGTSWDNVTSPTAQTLGGIGFGNNTFVAVGASGTILKSTDNGTSFSSMISPTSKYLYSAAYGNSSFVITGEDGTIIKER